MEGEEQIHEIKTAELEVETGSAVSILADDVASENIDAAVDQASVTKATSAFPSVAFIKVEKSLASLGFFTPSSRRIKEQKEKRISMTREIEGKRVEVTAEIIPSAKFGLPITADQDKYLALQKLISNILQTEKQITNPIRFKSADLLRVLNKSTKAGKNYKEVSEWLDVMSSTMIASNGAVYHAGQRRFVRDRFHVFDRVVSFGKELDDGSIADANYVWLSSWQIENINQNFLLPLDLDTYRELKNHIAKALVPLLQIWLFASQKAGVFEKGYEELCEILTLQLYRVPSLIRRQLKPSLDELTEHEYLSDWRIEKMSGRKAYKIVMVHGPKFHRDRRRRLGQKSNAQQPVVVAQFEPEEPSLPDPVIATVGEPATIRIPASVAPEVAKSDIASVDDQASIGREVGEAEAVLVDSLAARGILPSVALKLIQSLPEDRISRVPDYVDYWDSERRSKNVGTGLLFELIRRGEPLPRNFETGRQRAARIAMEARNTKLAQLEKVLRERYERFHKERIDHAVAQVPIGEYDSHVAEYKAGMMQEPGFWSEHPDSAEQFARHQIRNQIAKATVIEPYEKFRVRELPIVLEDLHLDPVELGIELTILQ